MSVGNVRKHWNKTELYSDLQKVKKVPKAYSLSTNQTPRKMYVNTTPYLNGQNAIGVGALNAAVNMNHLASAWGHLPLRFWNPCCKMKQNMAFKEPFTPKKKKR